MVPRDGNLLSNLIGLITPPTRRRRRTAPTLRSVCRGIETLEPRLMLAVVRITALDANAAETTSGAPANIGTFRISRDAATADPLTVFLKRSGTAINSKDYNALPTSVVIPANATFVDLAVTP